MEVKVLWPPVSGCRAAKSGQQGLSGGLLASPGLLGKAGQTWSNMSETRVVVCLKTQLTLAKHRRLVYKTKCQWCITLK